MQSFHSFVNRHGEHGVQALIEQIERTAGIRVSVEAPLPLEDRWNVAMAIPVPQNQLAA